jgi:hypothetical protein
MSAMLQSRLATNLRCPGIIPRQTSGAGTAQLVCNCCVLAIFAANLQKLRGHKTEEKERRDRRGVTPRIARRTPRAVCHVRRRI